MTAAHANPPLPFPAESQKSGCSPEFLPLSPSPVFDALWTFAAERQTIFWRRRFQQKPPWTTDSILQTFKFTNVYRASDRVSQYLIRKVIYSGDQTPVEVVFRTLLFKLFNKIETWELLEHAFGQITASDFSVDRYEKVLSRALASGRRIYSAAYIMPSGSHMFRTERKHSAHLQALEHMLKDDVAHKVATSKTLGELFHSLRSYPLLGDFLAYQYAIDLNYSNIVDFSESEFVVPGPGARNGIRKCFATLGHRSEIDVIRLVADLQEQEFRRRNINFQWLGDRRLQLIDVQNLFCEVDKYARVRFPDTAGISKRKRIKQRFSATAPPIDYWYPPKWGINQELPVAFTPSIGQSRLSV